MVIKMITAFNYVKAAIKRAVCALSAAAVMLNASTFAYAQENNQPDTKSSKAAIVTECSTGTVLFEKNAKERLPIASVTKLMCMLIWAEEISAGNLSFDDTVTCTAHANSMDGSVIWLETGEEMSAGDMIKSVVIASANDACAALCEHISGTEELFVKRMNERAESLGMNDTNFTNCVGFDDNNHYSTAYDIAILCAAVSEYDIYNSFFETRLDYVREGERSAQLLNTNKLMRYYSGIIGGKTGTTDNAGCCLAVWAKRGSMKLCAVELGCAESEQRFDVCENLLNYGFNGFEIYKPTADSDRLTAIKVENGIKKQVDIRIKRLITAVIPKGSSSRIEYVYSTESLLCAPVVCGQSAGNVTATLDGEVIFTSEIVTVRDVEELTFFRSMQMILAQIFKI